MAIKSDHQPLLLTSRGLNSPVGRRLFSQYIHPGTGDKALLISIEEYNVGKILTDVCMEIGFQEENIALCETREAIKELLEDYVRFSMIYIGEGNTYQLLDLLTRDEKGNYSDRFMKYLKEQIENGAVYCGSSAGAVIAGKDIRLVKDFAAQERNFSQVENYNGLNLFPGVVIPHYVEDDFVRFIYGKGMQESEPVLEWYTQLGYVDDESILVWDPEETTHLLDAYYKDVSTVNDLAFFLDAASNNNAYLLVYDGKKCKAGRLSPDGRLQEEEKFVSLGEDFPYQIPKSDSVLYRLYTLKNSMYGFRVEFRNQKLDIMIRLDGG